MTPRGQSADASFYYYEDATADLATMDSSAAYGNLADAMKDSILLFPDTAILGPAVVAPAPEDERSCPPRTGPGGMSETGP